MKTKPFAEPAQLEVFPDQAHLLRIDGARNMNRFYRMTVQRDLLGGACLVREWGRIGSAGRLQATHFADEGQAVDALAKSVDQKRKRGYDC